MKAVSRFSILKHEGAYETWGGTSQLIIDGTVTNHTVPGYTLLHQFEVDGGYLLLLDYDCPFEEALVAVRLNESYKVISKEVFGAMYTSWMLESLTIHDSLNIDLYFGGGPKDWWRLTLSEGRSRMKSRQIPPPTGT